MLAPCKNKLRISLTALAAVFAALTGAFFAAHVAYAQEGGENDYVDVAVILEAPDDQSATTRLDLNIVVVNHGARTAYDVEVVVDIVSPASSSHFYPPRGVPVGSVSLENSNYRLRWSIPELGGLQREEVTVESSIYDNVDMTFDKRAYTHEFFGTVTTSSFDSNPGNNTSRVWSVPYLVLRLRSFNGANGNYTVAVTVDEPSLSQGDTANFTITTGKLGGNGAEPIDLQVAIDLTDGLTVSGAPSYTSTTFGGDPVTKPSSVSYDSGVFTIGTPLYPRAAPYPAFHSVTLPITVASDAVVNEQCLTATLTGNPPPGVGPDDDDISDNVAKLCLGQILPLAPVLPYFSSADLQEFVSHPCVGNSIHPCDSTNDVRVRAIYTAVDPPVIAGPGIPLIYIPDTSETREYDADTNSVNSGDKVSWQAPVGLSLVPLETEHERWTKWKDVKFSYVMLSKNSDFDKLHIRYTDSIGPTFKSLLNDGQREAVFFAGPHDPAPNGVGPWDGTVEFEKLGTYKVNYSNTLTHDNNTPTDTDDVDYPVTGSYTFHVGPMADLEVRDGVASPHAPADQYALTIVAVNNGPDEPAGGATVTGLPTGSEVIHVSHGSYKTTGEWNIDRLRPRDYYRSRGESEPTLVLGASAGDTASVSIASAKNYEVCVGPMSNPVNLAHTTQATCEAVTNASWNSTPVYDYKPGNNTDVTITAQAGTGGGESAPSSMSARQYGAATYVTWEPVERVYGLPVAHYEVERNGVMLTDKPKGTTYLDSTGSGSVSYRVRAVNAAENPGPWSEASARRPGVPKNFSATVASSNTQIDLSWGAPDAVTGVTVSGYDVEYLDGATWTSLAAEQSALTYSHTGLTLLPGAVWQYRARTVGEDGDVKTKSGWTMASVTVANPTPGAPKEFSASIVSDTKANLSWGAPDNVTHVTRTGYELGFSKDGGNTWESLADQAATATSFTHTHSALSAGDTRQYRARTVGTVNSGGETVTVKSDWAFDVATRDHPTPGAPKDFTASGVSDAQANLEWSAPDAVTGVTVTGYDIDFSKDGGNDWDSLVQGQAAADTDFEHTDNTLGADAVRQYRARTVGTVIVGGETVEVKSAWAFAAATKDYPTPGAPRNFVARAISQSQVDLSWSAPEAVDGVRITGYDIDFSTDGANWSSLAQGRTATTFPHTDNTLAAGVIRQYRVRAVGEDTNNAVFRSGWVFASAATEEVGAPLNLTATADGRNRIDLTWDLPGFGADRVTGYRIDYTPATPEQWQTLEHNYRTTPRRYQHSGLLPGERNCYRVAAIYAGGTGPFTERACATTEGAPSDLPGEPENLRVDQVGSNFVVLEWDAPSVGGAVEYYEWQSNIHRPTKVSPRTATRVRVGGLSTTETYSFQVRAGNSYGPGGWSASIPVALHRAGGAVKATPAELEVEKGGSGSFNVSLNRSPQWPLRVYFHWEGPDCLTESLLYQQGKILLPTNPPPSKEFWEDFWWGPPEDRFARPWHEGLDIHMDASGCQGGETAVINYDISTVPFSDLEGLSLWEALNLNEEEWRDKWGVDPLDGASGPSVKVTVKDDGVGGQQSDDPGDSAGDAGPPTAVSLSLSQATVSESAGQVTVTATLDAPAPEGGIGGFLFAGEDGTASEDIDFTMPLGIFIPGGQRSGTDTISITDDDLDEADETVVMSALFDIGTALLEDNITLTITDDDTAGVTVNAASPLVVAEGGTVTYTVVLGSQPTADVTVTPTSDDPGAASVSPASRAFTPSAWDAPLTFTVSGVADTDTDDESVGISHGLTSDDPQYAVLQVSTVSVSVTDNTTAGQEQPQAPPNQPPTVSSAIADAIIINESGTKQVSLSGVFSDADSDSLTVTATSSNDAVATVSVADDYSTLTVNAQSRGTATVTATADDGNGGTVYDAFTVTVKAAPVVASAIGDMSLETEDTQDVSLSAVFSDADGDTLTFSLASSDDTIVSAFEFQGALTIVALTEGSATVTVTAEDSDGNQVSDAFEVPVSLPEVDHGEPTPVANLRCIAKTDQVAFLWDAPEWSGGELYAYDYDLTLPTGKREQVRLRGFSVVNEPGDYQVGKETSISVKVVYELPDESNVYSAAATLTCTVEE